MRIKKYTAKSMKEALLQIRAELGEDAMILKTAKLQKGILGLGGPDEIEVTAGIDDDAVSAAAGAGKRQPEFPPILPRVPGDSGARPSDPGLYGRPRTSQSALAADPMPVSSEPPESLALPQNVRPYFPPRQPSQYGRPPEPAQSAPRTPTRQFPAVKRTPDEIAELKADVHELKDLVKSVLTSASSPILSAPRDESGVTTAGDREWDAFVKRLTDAEVKPEIARKLVNSIRGGLQITDAELEEKLIDALSEQFPVSGPLKLKKDSPLIVAFVGPTGSGKTTTLAKLAAYCCMNKSKKVSIITADTYRIAAIEQIKTFADIVNVGLQIVFSPDEVPAALAECGDSDVIFVDNAGRSQRDKEHMEELRIMIDVLRPDETHLVLSATTKDSDLLDMVHRYRNIKVNRLLFTKLDETTRLGNIFNVVSDLGIPVSYFTVGQSVPDDIELAQAGKFVKRLMEGRAR
jgi:flagellar biosynthesis protein FlhF